MAALDRKKKLSLTFIFLSSFVRLVSHFRKSSFPPLGNWSYAEFSCRHKPHSIIFHTERPFSLEIRKRTALQVRGEENSFSLLFSTLSPAPFSSWPLLLLLWGCRRHHNHHFFCSSSCTRMISATIFTIPKHHQPHSTTEISMIFFNSIFLHARRQQKKTKKSTATANQSKEAAATATATNYNGVYYVCRGKKIPTLLLLLCTQHQ